MSMSNYSKMSSSSVWQLSVTTRKDDVLQYHDDPVVMASREADHDQYQTRTATATRVALIDNQLMQITTTAAEYSDDEDDDEDHNKKDYYYRYGNSSSSNLKNYNNMSYAALKLLEMKLGGVQAVQHNNKSLHYYVQQQQQQSDSESSEMMSSSHDNYYCYYNKQQQVWHKTLTQAEMLPRNEVLGGYIFVCNNETMQEDLHRQLFGLPQKYKDSVRAITPGLPLFLYNYTAHQLHGVFQAVSFGGSNIDPTAWEDKKSKGESRFPAQVRIRAKERCKPLEEDAFRPILYHYDGPKFRLQLSVPEVLALLDLFKEDHRL
ncbi:B2 protein-like [Rosa sericea]